MMKTRKGHNVYPITVAQKFHLYYAKYCPNMAVLNIGTSLTIGTELDWNVLRDSINYAYARNEAMRIRLQGIRMESAISILRMWMRILKRELSISGILLI